jgi:hypothetical protein
VSSALQSCADDYHLEALADRLEHMYRLLVALFCLLLAVIFVAAVAAILYARKSDMMLSLPASIFRKK